MPALFLGKIDGSLGRPLVCGTTFERAVVGISNGTAFRLIPIRFLKNEVSVAFLRLLDTCCEFFDTGDVETRMSPWSREHMEHRLLANRQRQSPVPDECEES